MICIFCFPDKTGYSVRQSKFGIRLIVQENPLKNFRIQVLNNSENNELLFHVGISFITEGNGKHKIIVIYSLILFYVIKNRIEL
jgi:hypothetical protein